MTHPPYIILLKGGPTHNIHDHLSYHAEVLSPEAEGEIWTFGSADVDETIGRFRVRSVKVAADSGLAAFREFLPVVSRDILSRADALRRRQVTFTTYEPFIQPFTGHRLARKLGGKLLIEFAGSYTHEHNFADVKNPWIRRLKYRQQQILAQAATYLADGVRLHYPGQADGFVHIPRSKPQSYYYDAIRLERFAAPDVKPENFVLMVGYPFYRKGVDVLIDAWNRVAARHPDWRLVLMGFQLDQHMRPEDLTSPQIQYLKPMDNAKAADWIKRCGIFVMPSRSDTMPRILMETAAAGRPRIATRVGGMPYMMEDGVSGLYVPPEDAAALATSLDRLMADGQLRERIGAAGLASVHDRFSGKRFRDDLLRAASTVHRAPPPASVAQAEDQAERFAGRSKKPG
jgi:glycosyltransferase involved in cell wall biosynthesis